MFSFTESEGESEVEDQSSINLLNMNKRSISSKISKSIIDHKLKKEDCLQESARSEEMLIFKFEDLPGWMQDNCYIQSGYRMNYTIAMATKSLFTMHNETWSIWSHFIGFIMFFFFTFITPIYFLENPSPIDIFIFTVFLICAQLQMLFSTLFHAYCCTTQKAYKLLAILDYTGISVMIVGSFFPPLYYGFYCNPGWRLLYMLSISSLGFVGIIVSTLPVFATPRYRVVRTIFFVGFACFAIVPVPHLWMSNGWGNFWPIMFGEAIMGSLYMIGCIIYATRIPECYYPGKFDCSCCSHVIWHCFSLAAALVQLYVCVLCYKTRKAFPCHI